MPAPRLDRGAADGASSAHASGGGSEDEEGETVRWIHLFLILGSAAALDGRQPAPAGPEKDVAAGNQAWVEGLKAGDADAVVAVYARDCVHCSAAGDCVSGPDAAAAQYREVIAKLGRATSAFVRSEALRVDHDLAYESGYAEAHFPGGAVRKGRFSTVWKLQGDGHWKIFRNMSLPPPPQ
jgi:uncharacterized protein (TIGR02246 family)